MNTPMDRGWGDPRDPKYRTYVKRVTVGPFPAGGALKKPHPQISVTVHQDIALVTQLALTEVVRDLGYRLDITPFSTWGYIFRPIRGYETKYKLTRSLKYISLHSWAIAIDLNAAINPLGKRGTMPKKVVEVMRRWGFGWGGDYVNRADEMHFEWAGSRAAAQQKQADLTRFFAGLKKAS